MYVQDAWKLRKRDNFIIHGRSDPYVRVTAARHNHAETTKTTSVKKNKEDATWNQLLYFGCGNWKDIDVSVWDEDSGSDDNLLPVRTFPICDSGECSVTYMHGESKLNFKIVLVPDHNECAFNPCYRGGVCTNGACGHVVCDCYPNFFGRLCEKYVVTIYGDDDGNGNDGDNIGVVDTIINHP